MANTEKKHAVQSTFSETILLYYYITEIDGSTRNPPLNFKQMLLSQALYS